MKTIRAIESFLDNRLEGTELKEFLLKQESDKVFAAEIELHREINESILDDDVAEFRRNISFILSDFKRLKRRRIISVVSGIAASLIIAFATLTFFQQTDFSKAYLAYYEPYDCDFNKRSAINNLTSAELAYIHYSSGEYLVAFGMLGKYLNSVEDDYTARFFYGISAMEIDKQNLAEKNLLQVASNETTPYALHAKWYLGILYLKQNKADQAKKILLTLSGNENFYSERANRIIKKYY